MYWKQDDIVTVLVKVTSASYSGGSLFRDCWAVMEWNNIWCFLSLRSKYIFFSITKWSQTLHDVTHNNFLRAFFSVGTMMKNRLQMERMSCSWTLWGPGFILLRPWGLKLKVCMVCHCWPPQQAVSSSRQWTLLPKHAVTTVLQTHANSSVCFLAAFLLHFSDNWINKEI